VVGQRPGVLRLSLSRVPHAKASGWEGSVVFFAHGVDQAHVSSFPRNNYEHIVSRKLCADHVSGRE
jgi:hypothetical protein